MIDLHTHTLLSDGLLLPSEMVRRAHVKGYEVIALADHVDYSNIDRVVSQIAKVAKELNRCWDIKVLPAAEITHAPLEQIAQLIKRARRKGARLVVVHGETVSDPVLPGTNREAISGGADILAHPGNISEEDARLAAKKGVHLEITTRKNHSTTNGHVAMVAQKVGAKLVVNTDAHAPGDLASDEDVIDLLRKLSIEETLIKEILNNSKVLAQKMA